MRLGELTFILTEDCNFRCTYCRQARGTRRLEEAEALRAVRSFRRFLEKEAAVCFYGGEPLLGFPVLRGVVENLERHLRSDKGGIHYTLTTNGSLMTPEILRFLERHGFSIILSFDGLAQDLSRRPGSRVPTIALIHEILARPSLRLEVYSVFTSGTVGLLAGSVEEMVSWGIGTIHLSLPALPPWTLGSLAGLKKALASLRPVNLLFFRKHGGIPIAQLRNRPAIRGLFGCSAGRDRLAVAPDGTVWGCSQIYDYARRAGGEASRPYEFGSVNSLSANPLWPGGPRSDASRGFDQTDLSTPRETCLFCPDLYECAVCPWSAALESGTLQLVAEDACRISRLLRNEERVLREACDKISPPSRQDGAGHLRSRAARHPRLSRDRGISGRILSRP